MKFSSSVILRKDYVRKDGKSIIYIRVTLDDKKMRFQTDIAVKPNEWDDKHHKVKPSVHNAAHLNVLIERAKARCDDIIVKLQLQERPVTFEIIKEKFYGVNSTGDFYSFFKKYIDDNKPRWAPGTLRHYNSELSKIKKFKPVLPFHEVKHEFILAYENYMIINLKNKINTVGKTFRKLKPVIAEALRTGHLNKNPFEYYRVRKEPTNRGFLTIEDTNKLYSLLPCQDEKINNVLKYFLFACYTGLRYLDVHNLCWKNVNPGYLNIQMNKTGEQIMIPLSSKAIKLMGEPQEPGTPIFRVLSNQKTNDYLKLIQSMAELKTTLSFHVARHTFATISLNLGIPIDVVSKLLGHNNLKTTQIYAKLLDSTKFEQMKKWEKV